MTAIDWEKYEAEERIKFIAKRDRDRHHKHQLDGLPTFLKKIDYWRREVFPEKKMATVSTRYYVADINSAVDFELSLKPQTVEDRRKLFDFWIECDRKHLAQERFSVEKFVYDAQKDGPNKIAFYVELVDDRKADLSSRLNTATRRYDLMRAELKAITDALDSATRTVNGFNGYYFNEVQHMRQCLVLNKPFDFDIEGRKFCSTEALKIAIVWDIVHYEYFLQNEVASLKSKPQPDVDKQNFPDTKDSREENIHIARRAINILDNQIDSIARNVRGNLRQPFKELVRKAINAYAEQIHQQGLNGYSEKSLGRYLKAINHNKTPKKYIEEKFRDTLSDKNKRISNY